MIEENFQSLELKLCSNESQKSEARLCSGKDKAKSKITRICTDSNCKEQRGMCHKVKCACLEKHNNCKTFISFVYIEATLKQYSDLNNVVKTSILQTLKGLAKRIVEMHNNFLKDLSPILIPPKVIENIFIYKSLQDDKKNAIEVQKLLGEFPRLFEIPENLTKSAGSSFNQLRQQIKEQTSKLTSAQEQFNTSIKKMIDEKRKDLKQQISNYNKEKWRKMGNMSEQKGDKMSQSIQKK